MWCLLSALPTAVATAQEPPIPRFCVVHRPECSGTAVTELLVGIHNHGELTALTVGFEGGLMRNVDKSAVGVSAYWAYQSHGHRWGIKPRVRRWVTRDLALDMSAGLILNSGEDRFAPTYPGFVTQVNLALAGVHGALVRIEFLSGPEGSTRDVTLGAQVGSKAGAAAGLLFLILGVMVESAVGNVYAP
jgi:hypothetical protein